MNTKQLQPVTFEQAKRLKKLGFDWLTLCFYYGGYTCASPPAENYNKIRQGDKCSAPTVPLALKWFRDEKKMRYIIAHEPFSDETSDDYYFEIEDVKLNGKVYSYEAAESALLDELLTVLEMKEKEQ